MPWCITAARFEDRRPASAYCPIARAVNRELGLRPENVHVYEERLDIEGSYFELPRVARQFIYDYDGREKVQPFAFEIDMDAEIPMEPEA